MQKLTFNNTDEYIALQEPGLQIQLNELRNIIKKAAPEAEEYIGYQMPAYRWNGPIIYFAAAKQHIGIYPTASPIVHFATKLTKYKTSKGAIQLPIDEPLPAALITEIVHFKLEENKQKVALKTKVKK